MRASSDAYFDIIKLVGRNRIQDGLVSFINSFENSDIDFSSGDKNSEFNALKVLESVYLGSGLLERNGFL